MTTKATHCRFCGKPGELEKGAHNACKMAAWRAKAKTRAIPIPPRMCEDCGARHAVGKSPRCGECRYNRSRTKWRSRRKALKPKKPCACGCGRPAARKFATKQCYVGFWQTARRSGPAPAKPNPAPHQKFIGPLSKPKNTAPVEPAKTINPGVAVTRIPSLYPDRLRDLFGTHGAARTAED